MDLIREKYASEENILSYDVRHLKLENLDIQSIAAYTFSSFTRLSYLNLDRNKIESLPNNAFGGLRLLRELSMSINCIRELETNCFLGLTSSLKKLFLKNNRLTLDSLSSLRCLNNLLELDLSYNKIESLCTDTFSQLTQLTWLNLANNKLTMLDDQQQPANYFDGLSNLKDLNLSGNQIYTFDSACIADCARNHLSRLNLSHNKMTRFYFLISLTRLTELDLSFNEIDKNSLHVCKFASLTNLSKLNLQNNKISTITPNILNIPQLKELDLSNNRIKMINLEGLANLKVLNLSNNSLKSVSATTFSSLPLLTNLNLTDNPIREVHTDAFKAHKNLYMGPYTPKLMRLIILNLFLIAMELLLDFFAKICLFILSVLLIKSNLDIASVGIEPIGQGFNFGNFLFSLFFLGPIHVLFLFSLYLFIFIYYIKQLSKAINYYRKNLFFYDEKDFFENLLNDKNVFKSMVTKCFIDLLLFFPLEVAIFKSLICFNYVSNLMVSSRSYIVIGLAIFTLLSFFCCFLYLFIKKNGKKKEKMMDIFCYSY